MNDSPFTRFKVSSRLRSCENTSPGPDGITYSSWKKVDPNAEVLPTIYNLCLVFGRVPASWKATTTILIYKKGDRYDPGNWRPISLGNTIYKLYSSCTAKRMNKWIESNNILSFNQKGFLPFDGVFENNFVLEHHIRHAKMRRKDVFFASLDIANAFGSLPHWTIFAALEEIGVGEKISRVVQDMYRDAKMAYKASKGCSTLRNTKSGVRQGDPLSGLLFIITMDFLIRETQKRGEENSTERETRHHILAYADDIVLLANAEEELQNLRNLRRKYA